MNRRTVENPEDYLAWANWFEDNDPDSPAPYEHGDFPNTTMVLRAHAALLEENAKLKRHAEAMALDIERLIGWSDSSANYRAEFPKEPR